MAIGRRSRLHAASVASAWDPGWVAAPRAAAGNRTSRKVSAGNRTLATPDPSRYRPTVNRPAEDGTPRIDCIAPRRWS